MKPALLIEDCWLEVVGQHSITTTGYNAMRYDLALSQEQTMNPSLLLPIGQFGSREREVDATGSILSEIGGSYLRTFEAQNTLWAAKYVSVRGTEVGTIDIDVSVHLDYTQVEIPFWDWFLMWDFLDNVVDGTKDY